jgi:HD-GYP domain-containing protein (c-di-GMP phosphodiesterase class II)
MNHPAEKRERAQPMVEINAESSKSEQRSAQADRFRKLIDIGIALSAERDHARLMEMILVESKELCGADGGTLYLRTEDDCLKFDVMRTDSLNIAMGGTTGKDIPFPPLRMYDETTGEPNHKNVSTHTALTGRTINIPDAYEATEFDFSGTKKFDEGTGYRSKSFFTVPLKNHQEEVIGVLQLINSTDPETGEVVPFNGELEALVEALASQAAVALDNQQLMAAQKNLLDSFIKLIASAIDAKSPYTGGHCQRVPELSMMIGKAACESDAEPFADFDLDEDQWYELSIAGLLHDCGKVTTPEYVVDKATKLETIYNRIHEIRTRFEVVKRDAVIDYLKALLDSNADAEKLQTDLEERLAALDDDFAFVAECNIGGEFMDPEKVERLKGIAEMTWSRTLDDQMGLSRDEMDRLKGQPTAELPVTENLLSDKQGHIVERLPSDRPPEDDHFGFRMEVPEHKYNLGELYNLSIARGTLTAEERFKINDHIVQTIVMLEQLPFPKTLKRVPEFAGGHHETMIGSGYPRKLSKEDMPIPARIMAVADIFEALTAADRPYKEPKKLSDAIRILSFMRKDQHIDGDIFELFLTSGIYKDYAERFLNPDQLDEVDISQYVSAGD